jgi:hypothetical protein
MEATRSSETSSLTRSTLRHIPEHGILHRHRRENNKSHVICKIAVLVLHEISCRLVTLLNFIYLSVVYEIEILRPLSPAILLTILLVAALITKRVWRSLRTS